MPIKLRMPNEAFSVMSVENKKSMLILGGKISENLSDTIDFYDIS